MMKELKEKLIALLKLLKVYPSSGYGEIIIKIVNNQIILFERKEQLKIED